MADRGSSPAAWMGPVLRAAALYNVVWGAMTVLYPAWLFELTGLTEPTYPFIWQCVGMIVGVYGVGYWCAARNPYRHWPIVLVGFLGKVFGPIGYVAGVWRGDVPTEFGVTLPTNDLIWWVPFVMMLWGAFRHRQAPESPAMTLDEAMKVPCVPSGRTLAELSTGRGCVVFFLRHSGCTFCRETLAALAARRTWLDEGGLRLVLVHQDDDEARASTFFARYALSEFESISDPQGRVYRAFELERGSFHQLFGLRVLARGIVATLRGNFVGALVGDGFRMPGAFLVRDGRIRWAFRHRLASDRVDYCGLESACGLPA